jgi:hypothetical protein
MQSLVIASSLQAMRARAIYYGRLHPSALHVRLDLVDELISLGRAAEAIAALGDTPAEAMEAFGPSDHTARLLQSKAAAVKLLVSSKVG